VCESKNEKILNNLDAYKNIYNQNTKYVFRINIGVHFNVKIRSTLNNSSQILHTQTPIKMNTNVKTSIKVVHECVRINFFLLAVVMFTSKRRGCKVNS